MERQRRKADIEKGLQFIPLAAKAMALPALDLIEDPALLRQLKEENRRAVAEQ